MIVALLAPAVTTTSMTHQSVLGGLDQGVLFLAFGLIGVIVAWHQPRNPMGWTLLGVPFSFGLYWLARSYALLDYRFHRGSLPLGWVAVLLGDAWAPVCWLAWLISQAISFRRAHGERRWQLNGLLSGAAFLVSEIVLFADDTPAGWMKVVEAVATIGTFALPASMGFGIMKFRLYDIDPVHQPHPGVCGHHRRAAGDLRGPGACVDRRFNRARYDADQVAAFAARRPAAETSGRAFRCRGPGETRA